MSDKNSSSSSSRTSLCQRPGWNAIIGHVVRNFSPVWFAATMGTGAISGLFNAFPYQGPPMMVFSLIFFFLNLLLFVLFTGLTIARFVLYPETWSPFIEHPVDSLFLSCMPMGGATLLNVAIELIHKRYHFGGRPFLYTIWGLWWLDLLLSGLCCWGMAHFMFTKQVQKLESMTTVWLLPVVTLIVASSSGGIISLALQTYSFKGALVTITISVFIVTVGFSLAFMILSVYLLRLILYGLPSGISILSVFLPLGPTGQAGFGVMLIGQSLEALLPIIGSSPFLSAQSTGEIIQVFTVCTSFMLWSLATMWIFFALLGVSTVLRKGRIPFKLTYWGLVFPNGVYANLTIYLATAFDSRFFRVYGAMYSVITLLIWLFVAVKTPIWLYSQYIKLTSTHYSLGRPPVLKV
ncbi:hypothetical protein AX16_002030 [Volvariella volvacea WC 439]|nr:hypothetical protein AX16_002030 [Volvariella volvacea WC 439]